MNNPHRFLSSPCGRLRSPAMAVNPKSPFDLTLLTISLFFFTIITPSFSLYLHDDSNQTVYEILPIFGLPSGLLPDSVVDYSLSSDGSFVVHLKKPCYVEFDYLVYYDTTITGKLSYGSITDLEGIQVRRFFLWLDVDEIRVDLPPSASIYFQVGFINKKLDIDQFKTIHSCRDSVTGSRLGSLKRVFELGHRKSIMELRFCDL
ncbi:uncharacterized protein LOC114723852 isoform X2 [Neltuma alba]|uniref:uncharacterized protein LOC114723852 isoform X2 n=1 Tax=Neltuma alba TaxID=207710 RepID=UPI0010A543C3|nr:uncharacterized protein LOC114723852 isoform X2 [Prosopis alba]